MQNVFLRVAWNSRSRSALFGWVTVSHTICSELLLQPDLLRPVRSLRYWLQGAQLLRQLNDQPAVRYPQRTVQGLD